MSLINRNEIRRLEKAAREKDKKHLMEWADKLEGQIAQDLRRQIEATYNEELGNAIDNILIAVVYALYFSEETMIEKEAIPDFMEDLFVTIDLFRTGEYTPQEYKDQLQGVGIILDRYDYDRIYKKYIGNMNKELVQYLKHKPRKTILVCGNIEFKNDIINKFDELTANGNLVILDNFIADTLEYDDMEIMFNVSKDRILMSDILFVYNKDNKINSHIKARIDYAKSQNIEIQYLENKE